MAEADVTLLLEDVEAGRPGAFDRLLAQVYPALRQLRQMARRAETDAGASTRSKAKK
jgi:hypothetical protein